MSQPTDSNAPDCGANSAPCPDECCDPLPCPETEDPSGPDEHPGSDYSEQPVRFATGEIHLVTEDLAYKNFGVSWGHTRSYSNRVTEPGVGRNGNSWFVKEWPYLSPSDASANPTTICLIWVIQEALWFDWDAPTSTYKARFFLRPKLRHDTTAQVFTLFDSDGRTTTFYDFSASHGARRGQFKSFTDARGRETEATYDGDRILSFVQVSGGLSSGYHYGYVPAGPNAGRLEEVLYKVNGTAVRRVRYTYYEPIDIYGSPGDLKLVTMEKPDGANWTPLTNTYYRYYKAGDPNGVVHGLQFVLNPLGYQQMVDAFITPESASPEDLRRYAKHEFRYNADRRVVDETVNSGTANYGFGIEESGFVDDFNHWKRKTTESLPDGSRRIVFTNFAGQVMLKVFIQMKGGDETTKRWFEYRKFDDDGRTILEASSSAIVSYDEADETLVTPEDLKDHQGLIRLTNYYPANPPTGGAPFRIQYRKVQRGKLGDEIKLREWKYKSSDTFNGNLRYVPGEEIVYRSASNLGSDPVSTEFFYVWDHCQVAERTTQLPPVPAAQNGPNDADTIVEAFDECGRVTWRKDARGFNTHYEYLAGHEQPTRVTEDASGAPWDTGPEAPHLNLITDHILDEQGRIVETLGPVHPIAFSSTNDAIRRVRWTVYRDLEREQWEADGCRTEVNGGYLFIGPVHIERYDEAGRLLESIQATRTNASGPLSPSNTFPQSSYIRWTLHLYTGHANIATRRVYHKIPTDSPGFLVTNFNDTHFQYDILHRIVREQSPGGTITRLVYHPLGWVLSRWIGTNDLGGDDRNPAGPRPWPRSPNNMVKVEEYRYDGGSSGGDGNLTRLTQYATATDPRITDYFHDFRNRRTSANGEIDFFESYTYDNEDRVVETLRKDTSSNGPLVARSETLYDNRGRVYRTLKYGIDPATGTGSVSLKENIWYDPVGNVIKQQPAGSNAFTKIEYDAVNRPIAVYLAFDSTESSGAPIGALSNDTVIEQTETTYDAAGNATVQLQRLRFHNTSGTGPLEGPNATQRAARILYSITFPDPLGRMRASANYGSREWTTPNPPTLVPTPSDTILVTSVFYNNRGEATETKDPAGRVQKTTYDHAGRREKEEQNFIPGGPDHDQNKTTSFTYTPDGALETLTAHNIVTTNQVTLWEYGTVLSNDCYIASSLLVRKKVYPDAPTDRVTFKYNRLGQVTEMKDQRDVIHIYDYDKLGRLAHDRVTSLGPSGIVDGTVRRISYGYEVRGLTRKITSVNNPAPTAGAILNEVLNEYNSFEQLHKQHQSHSGVVVIGTTPRVQYDYANGVATPDRPGNTIRLEKLTYPNNRELHYSYGALTTNDNQLSRVRALIDNDTAATHLVEYDYLGANTFVIVAYPQPQLSLTYVKQGGESFTDGGDQYTGLDRFGRIIDQRWLKAATPSPVPVERLEYGYDRLSNRLWRRNEVAPAGHDELYTHDGLSQIKSLHRGTLNNEHTTISSPTWQEDFTYDPTGNWDQYGTQVSSNSPVTQIRTHNQVNALTKINNSTSLLASDPAGNMTRTPKPSSWTEAYDMAWDAWNRLIRVTQPGSTIATNGYDGLARRTTQSDAANTARHYYYSQQWQILEERSGANTTAERQFVCGEERLDDLIARDRFPASGIDRLFSLSSPLSVTAIANPLGAILERYEYSAFGTPSVMTGTFGPLSASLHSWETRFAAYRWDDGPSLHQVRFRFLHSSIGRWLSRDPIEESGGINLYAYVENQPSGLLDSLGLVGMFPPPPKECSPCKEGRKMVKDALGNDCCPEDIKISPKGHRICSKPRDKDGKEKKADDWPFQPPQWFVDAAAGFGDTWTFGVGAAGRELAGAGDQVNVGSGSYLGGAGVAVGTQAVLGGATGGLMRGGNSLKGALSSKLGIKGGELGFTPLGKTSPDFRINFFGGSGYGPHYHRRPGIGKHRPWQGW